MNERSATSKWRMPGRQLAEAETRQVLGAGPGIVLSAGLHPALQPPRPDLGWLSPDPSPTPPIDVQL